MDHLTFAQILGNYGEFFGAVAVVVTLIYLAIQIRQNTKQLRGEAITTTAAITSTLTSEIRDDPHLVKIILQAGRDWDDPELTGEDRSRVHLWNMQEFQLLETQFLLMKEQMLNADYYQVRENYLMRRLIEPGTQTWWNAVRYNLSEEFVDRLNARLSSVEGSPASSLPMYEQLLDEPIGRST